jgi:hypothetical protein
MRWLLVVAISVLQQAIAVAVYVNGSGHARLPRLAPGHAPNAFPKGPAYSAAQTSYARLSSTIRVKSGGHNEIKISDIYPLYWFNAWSFRRCPRRRFCF